MEFIKNKISSYLNGLNSDYKNMDVLHKVSNIMRNSKVEFTLDHYIDIVRSFDFINNILASMYLKYKEDIISKGIEFISSDENVVGMFEAYFSINDIEVNIVKLDNITSDIYYDYVKCIEKRTVLTKEQEHQIIKKIQDTKDIKLRNSFVENNLTLVISIARRYVGFGLDFMDLIQEGNIGLLKAIERFDVTHDYKFSTYAVFWIKQGIQRALANSSRLIRLPAYQHFKYAKYMKFTNQFINKYGVEPTASEISDFANIPLDEVLMVRQFSEPIVSIHTKINDDNDFELMDVIADDCSVEDDVEKDFLKKDLIKFLEDSNLDSRYVEILMLRFGINCERPYKLEEVAKIYNLSRERVRQIEHNALVKLRRSKNLKQVIDYSDQGDKRKRGI